MRRAPRRLAFTCMAFAALAASAEGLPAQTASPGAQTLPTSPAPVPGYFDAATNSFKTLDVSPSASTSNRSGTIQVVGNIDIDSGIPNSVAITATASILETGKKGNPTNIATATGTVTRSTPSKGTVTLTIPFDWQVPSGTVSITVIFGVSATVSNSTSGTTFGWSNGTSFAATLPANGKTTTVTVNDAL